jgi:hypothetical protein
MPDEESSDSSEAESGGTNEGDNAAAADETD